MLDCKSFSTAMFPSSVLFTHGAQVISRFVCLARRLIPRNVAFVKLNHRALLWDRFL